MTPTQLRNIVLIVVAIFAGYAASLLTAYLWERPPAVRPVIED